MKITRVQLGAVVATAAVVVAGKQFDRGASADELQWLLAPVAQLVGWITGASFAYDSSLGWVSRDDLRNQISADFEKAVFALKKGQISGIIKSQYGYHIVKMVDKRGSVDQSFSDWLAATKKSAKITKFIKS